MFTTALGLMAFLPVLALYIEEEFEIVDPQQVAMWAAMIFGAGPFAAACMGPIWGALGDRFGKKRMAVRANLAIAVTTACMPLAPSPMWLLAIRVAQGMFAGYVAPVMALGTGQLPRYVHGRIIARLQTAMALGTLLGPYLGAEITGLFGRSGLFWVASVFSLISAIWLQVRAVELPPLAAARRHSFFGGFWLACRSMLGNRVLATLLLMVMVLRLGQNIFEPMVSLFVRELGPQSVLLAISGSESMAVDRTIALAFGVMAIAQWFCTPVWGRMADRHGPLRCLIVLSIALAVVQALTSLVANIDQFLLMRCACACAMAGSMTLAFAAMSKRVPDEHRTLAFALVQSCIQFGLALGPLLGAFVVRGDDGPDFHFAFVVGALLCGVAGLGMLLLRRVERRSAI
ncbi:MAG: DHA1 family multidrug resistance protein-like MFS transporter [Planctomycetota bacterium]